MRVREVDDAIAPSATRLAQGADEPLRQLSGRLSALVRELRRVSEGAASELSRDTAAAIAEVGRASTALEAALAFKAPGVGASEAAPASYPRPLTARITFDDIIGEDPAFRASVDLARRAAQSDLPILVSGETGTGKEMFAQAIHNASARARSPFVGINVAALPRELVESELFGHAQGAFTGARAGGKAGLFELAEDGTVLLDEVGDMPFDLQVKILRVLQERSVMRVGGSREVQFRARVIATTHRDLKLASEMGTFRADLYYRLRGIHVRIPALRDRRSDIGLLIDTCLSRFAARAGRPRPQILPRVLAAYQAAEWRGNVRELVHTIEAEASLLRPGETHILRLPTSLQRASLPIGSSGPPPPESVRPPAPPSSRRPAFPGDATTQPEGRAVFDSTAEQRLLEETLATYDGNISKAARALGVARGTLYNRMRRLGLWNQEDP